ALTPSEPIFFFSTAPPTPEIYTLSLHDALPISAARPRLRAGRNRPAAANPRGAPSTGTAGRASHRRAGSARPRRSAPRRPAAASDRKSTRLNSSHVKISYAVFCLKKKKNKHNDL